MLRKRSQKDHYICEVKKEKEKKKLFCSVLDRLVGLSPLEPSLDHNRFLSKIITKDDDSDPEDVWEEIEMDGRNLRCQRGKLSQNDEGIRRPT